MTAQPVTYTATLPVAVYGRISKRTAGDGRGAHVSIDDQQAATWDRMAPDFPGAAVVPFRDNLSAWDPDVVRDEWELLLEGVRAGRFAAVGAWAPDRFTRQPEQMETLWKACKATGTQLWTAHSGRVESMLALRIQMAVAADESDTKSRRLKMKHQGKAQRGQFHGGKRRYGYTPKADALVPSEAQVIREAAAAVLAGSSLFSIAADLRDREVPTALGGQWTGPNLGAMLRRPHLAGLRAHTVDGTTTLYDADWPAVLDRSTWERLQLHLGNGARKTNRTGNARKYLLAGWATCDTCGADLRGRPGTKANPSRRAYACATGRHCYRAIEDVDTVVETRVVRRLTRMTSAGQVTLDGVADDLADLAQERDDLAQRLAEYAAAAGSMSPAAYAAATGAIERDLAAVDARMLEAEATKARPLAVLEGMTGPTAADAWKAADLNRKRAVLDLLCSVSLRGAATRRAPFDPEDVVTVWKIPQAR
jgi:hypothetical protein